MLTAVKYLRPVGRGVTAPHIVQANDGEVYIVKFQTNRIGPKVLVNELLASRLGEWWELCFPPSGIIEISQEVLAQSPNLARQISPGLHFASQYLRGCRYINRHLLHKAINKQEMAGIMLFDHLFHNVDRTRNPRNLLIRQEDKGWRLYAIDHSHLFYRGNWSEESLGKLIDRVVINRQRAYGVLLNQYLSKADFLPYLERVNATSDAIFANLVMEVPQEWLPGAKERELLTTWLCQRRSYADILVERLCTLTITPHL